MKRPALSDRTKRSLSLLIGATAVLALFLLSAGLPGLEMRPAQRFIFEQQPEPPPLRPLGPLPPAFLDALLAVVAILFVVSLLFLLKSREDRKQVLKHVGQLLLLALVAMLILSQYQPEKGVVIQPSQATAAPALNPTPETSDLPTAVPIAISPPVLPGWLAYVLALAVVLGGGALLYLAWWMLQPQELQLRDIAQSALDDLVAGRDWEDTIIRCYADMSAALSRSRGLRRPRAMTPREFAARLEKAGLPAGAVHTLTQLFEKARYSSHETSTQEVRAAIDCLSTIVRAAEQE